MPFLTLFFSALGNGEPGAITFAVIILLLFLWMGWVTLRLNDLRDARKEFPAVRENNIHIQNQIEEMRKKLP
jgi:hypothetical protein